MSTLAIELNPLAKNVKCSDAEIFLELADGRTVSAPLVWFPRLAHATKQELDNWELLGDGEGIHWPKVDEDLSVAGLLMGKRPINS